MPRVLLIDDDLMLSRLIQEHLLNEGLEVTTSSMAEEGVESALKNPPDLIMLDVFLPDATGFQTCGKLKKDPRTKHIPIIMMTGAARHPNQQKIAKELGATEYVLKPFDIVEVGDKVHEILGSKSPFKTADFKELPAHLGAAEDQSMIEPRNEKCKETSADPLVIPTSTVLMNQVGSDGHSARTLVNARAPDAPVVPPEPILPTIHFTEFHADPGIDKENHLSFEAKPPMSDLPKVDAPDDSAAPAEEKTSPPLPEVQSVEQAPAKAMEAPPEIKNAPAPAIPEPTDESAGPIISLPQSDNMPAVTATVEAAKAPASAAAAVPFRFSRWMLTWFVFASHLAIVAGGAAWAHASGISILQSVMFTAGTWFFFLGLLVGAAGVFHLPLESKDALQSVGIAAIPIVFKTLLHVFWAPTPVALPASVFWMRPLDIFEIASLTLLGFSLRHLKGSSLAKCIVVSVAIGLTWALARWGYYHSF